MRNSFLCRIFKCGCKCKTMIFSATIAVNQGETHPDQGDNDPADIPEISGWKVLKPSGTIEFYKIIHNLGLTDPERQMHIVATPVATPDIHNTILTIEHVGSNDFTISTGYPMPPGDNSLMEKQSAFMFIAVLQS